MSVHGLLLVLPLLGPTPRVGSVEARQDDAAPQRIEGRAAALARRMASAPTAEPGAWNGWRDAPVPPDYGAALEAYRADDLVATWALALDCLQRHPDHPAALSLAGGVAFRLRRYEDAILAYERFLVHAPESLGRTRHLGHALYSVGRYGEARAHYGRMLDEDEAGRALRDGARRAVHLGRALAEWRTGDPEAALAFLDKVLAEEPLSADAWTWRATIAFDEEELEAALADARRARGLAPYDPRPAFLLARVLDELAAEGDETGSIAAEAARVRQEFERLAAVDARSRELEARLVLEPRDAELRRELLGLRESVGNPRGVLREAAALARWAAGDATSQRLVLAALERHGRSESATAHAGLLERRFADDVEMLRTLAAFYGRAGDTQAQLRCGARAAALGAAEKDGESTGGDGGR